MRNRAPIVGFLLAALAVAQTAPKAPAGTVAPFRFADGQSALSGPAMLTQSAMDAVRQWVYKPMLLNGQAVEALTQAEVNFSLLQ